MLRHTGALRAALAAVLAAFAAGPALAPEASAVCLPLDQRQRPAIGPIASPLGGAWFVLPHADGAVEVVQRTAGGKRQRSLVLRAPGAALRAYAERLAVDERGRFRVVGSPRGERIDPERGRNGHLYAFGDDGEPLGSVPLRGQLFAIDRHGFAHTVLRGDDGRLTLLRHDALSGEVTETLTVEVPVLPGTDAICGYGFELALHEDGVLIHVTWRFDWSGGHLHELRLVAPTGRELAAWSLPIASFYGLTKGIDGTAYLWTGDSTLRRIGVAGVEATYRLAAQDVRWIEPLVDGSFLVHTGAADLRWLARDGDERARYPLDPRDRAEHQPPAAPAVVAEPAPEPQAPETLDGWLARIVEEPTPRGAWQRGVRRLLAADPDTVGRRLDAQLDHLPAAVYPTLVATLANRWPRPSPAFVDRLEDDLLHGDDDRQRTAAAAFVGQDQLDPVETHLRLPASEAVIHHFLDDLAAAPGSRSSWLFRDAFFLAQFPIAAPHLDALLTAPDGPSQAVVGWLDRLPALLTGRSTAREPGTVSEALAAWAPRWAASDDRRLARAARLLAAATGDPQAVAALPSMLSLGQAQPRAICDVLRHLQHRHPELLDAPFLERLTDVALTNSSPLAIKRIFYTLEGVVPPAWWSTVAARLADPELPPPAAQAIVELLVENPKRHAGITPGVYRRVARSGFVERRLAGTPRSADFQLAGRIWEGLADESELRASLESAFLAACTAERDGELGDASPPGCMLGMAAGGVGRGVPDDWLAAWVDHYRGLERNRIPRSWAKTFAAIAARRGPWPGLAEVLTRHHNAPTIALAFSDDLFERVTGFRRRSWHDLPTLDLDAAPDAGGP